jgi:hypothetical protein
MKKKIHHYIKLNGEITKKKNFYKRIREKIKNHKNKD